MKVRNLKQYIEILTKNSSSIPALGGEDDFLLIDYYGKKVILDQHLTDLPNFATDPRTQIYYELMQNAEDAESESLHFFFNDHGILVLNNGRPFRTDSTEGGGQLFEFLFKGKGQKANNPKQIGEHGQGSKLLYSLILPNEYGGDKKESVRKNLMQELRGPILLSWQKESDVMKLCTWSEQPFEYTGNCEDQDYPLLTKIILTYYPAELGEVATLYDGREEELFSKTEMASLVQFLNKIRFNVTWTDFRRGTLLYIPLGEGQGEKMVSNWGSAVKQGISFSLDFLKHLKYVYVNGEQIRRSGLNVVQLADLTTGEKPVSLQLAMPNVHERLDDKAINFYKFFPIARARYGLNYLINTKAYDVGAARQEIDITDDNNNHILMDISVRIVEYIKQLREDGDRGALILFLRCAVWNSPNDNFFREYFHEKIVEAFANNLPTEVGFADSASTVRIKKTDLPIQPEALGISEWAWLDESLADVYDQVGSSLGINSCTLTDLLEAAAEKPELKTWMFSLAEMQYLQLLEEVQATVQNPFWITGIRCWRFSDGEVYTLKEILENDTLILVLPEMAGLDAFLKMAEAPIGGWGLEQLAQLDTLVRKAFPHLIQLMWERVTKQLSAIENLPRDDKWAIFRIYHADTTGQKYLEEQLGIFLNTRQEKKALGHLTNKATTWTPSGILDSLSILAAEFIPEMEQYFIAQEAVWEYLLHHWQIVEEHLQAGARAYPAKLQDVCKIFNSAPARAELIGESVPWILLPSGALASSEEVFCQEGLEAFNAEQYTGLNNFISSNTSLKLVDPELFSALLEAPFAPACQSGLEAIKWGLQESEIIVGRSTIELLYRIRTIKEGFFNLFTIKSANSPNTFLLSKNDGGHTQYFTADTKLIEFLDQVVGYKLLPKELLNVFEGDASLKNEPADDDFVVDLINDFGANEALVDIVLQRKATSVQQLFLEKIKAINILSDDKNENYKDTFEFKSIKILTKHESWIGDYKHKVFIDSVNIEKFEYRDDVKFGDLKQSFSLAKLLPEEFGELSGKLASVKPKMAGSRFGDLLTNKQYDPNKIINNLAVAPNAYQLAFLVANSHLDPSESGLRKVSIV